MKRTKFKKTEIGKIPVDWEMCVFSQAVYINPRRELRKGTIAKKVSMQGLQELRRKIVSYERVKYNGGTKFQNNDTLMARITPCLENGKTAFVDILDNNETGFGSTEFNVLCGKEGKTNHKFVYYLSRSPLVRAEAINSMVGTSGRQRVQNDVFDNMLIPIPSIAEQKAIAKILSDLDSKIEINLEMNKTLETIGQAIFKRWFVDFEFRNDEGKPYRSSGGEMIKSELREIPKGWGTGVLSDITEVVDCLHSRKPGCQKTGKYLLQVYNIGVNGELDLSEPYYVSEKDYNEWTRRITVKAGDLIISKTGRVGAMAQIIEGFEAGVGRNLVCIRHVGNKSQPAFLKEYLLSPSMRIEIDIKTHSGTVLKSLHVKEIEKLRIMIPPYAIIEKFEVLVRPIQKAINLNIKNNLTLVQIRDSLLPCLISGRIRVSCEETQ